MWPFTKPKPKIVLTVDWHIGNLAECVREDWNKDWLDSPKVGDILRVCDVHARGLFFIGKDPTHGWNSRAFRKIVQDYRPAESWFADRMKQTDNV